MNELTVKTKLHKRMCNFVDWIAPNPNTVEDIKARMKTVREKIKAKAEVDGLIVSSTPNSGSFAKKTGLRRHLRGESEVEGQDIDLPFVVKPKTQDGEKLDSLLDKFKKYVEECYPNTEIVPTKSSIKLNFSDRVSFDIVPMLETNKTDEQIIIRSNGDKIKTCVEKHISFVTTRTESSNQLAGRVKFNECVRLMKWWRDYQAINSAYLTEDDKPSSMLIDLLCAKAYDEKSVDKTYAETLSRWCAYLANLVRNKNTVYFNDFQRVTQSDINQHTDEWVVLDPVNKENNVAKKLDWKKCNELAEWFERTRDNWARVIRFDNDGEDSKSLDNLIKIFGNAFKNHCDN